MNTTENLAAFDAPREIEATPAPPLANRKAPHYEVKQERPAHRLMLELAARGFDIKEISQKTGYCPVTVNNILRQQHVQQTLVESIRQVASQDEEVIELVKSEVLNSIKAIRDIRDSSSAAAATRLAAAESILNRRYGKPNQPVNRNTDVDLNALSIAEIAATLTSGTGTNTPGVAG